MRNKGSAYRILVGKAERKRPLRRRRRKWLDNIKMDFREIGWVGMYWEARDKCRALLNKVTKLWVP
jgi:hypothetical protein